MLSRGNTGGSTAFKDHHNRIIPGNNFMIPEKLHRKERNFIKSFDRSRGLSKTLNKIVIYRIINELIIKNFQGSFQKGGLVSNTKDPITVIRYHLAGKVDDPSG